KMARIIVIAARERGGDPATNSTLRMVIEKARGANMPADNIERAIKRATGEGASDALEGFLYEAFGPGGAAILVEGITDNKNRTLPEVRKIITEHGGRMADPGSLQWMFERKGYLELATSNQQPVTSEMELKVIDAGAEDLKQTDAGLVVYTAPEKLMEVKKSLEGAGIAVGETGFEYIAKNPVSVSDEKVREQLEKFFEVLDEHDDVQEIYSNSA
ncbi:MAG: YebC/PmpR family DNA-binding transcriptional regulator, partial [bacterium]|nr:YebC/PmpR family DNA-binding transcriptional regulator [bacterium]